MSKGAVPLMTNIIHVGIDQFYGLNRGKRCKSAIKAERKSRLDDKDIIEQGKLKKSSCLVKKFRTTR